MKGTLLEMNRKTHDLYNHDNKAILRLLELWGYPEKVYEDYLTDLQNRGLLENTRDTSSSSSNSDSDSSWERKNKKKKKKKAKEKEFKPLGK